MTHRIDRRSSVLPQLDPQTITRGWERDLLHMRMCLQCGKWLAPQLWESPCAWSRPEYRLERLPLLALGRLK